MARETVMRRHFVILSRIDEVSAPAMQKDRRRLPEPTPKPLLYHSFMFFAFWHDLCFIEAWESTRCVGGPLALVQALLV